MTIENTELLLHCGYGAEAVLLVDDDGRSEGEAEANELSFGGVGDSVADDVNREASGERGPMEM